MALALVMAGGPAVAEQRDQKNADGQNFRITGITPGSQASTVGDLERMFDRSRQSSTVNRPVADGMSLAAALRMAEWRREVSTELSSYFRNRAPRRSLRMRF